MKIKYLFLGIVILLCLNLVSADYSYVFEKDVSANLHIKCFDINNSHCLSSTNCQTSINYPNQTYLAINQSMTFNETYFNYTVSNRVLGGHFVIITCQGSANAYSTFNYLVTPTGEELTTARGMIYILLTVLIFLLFLFVLYVTIALPMKNEKDNRGQTIKIIKKKYIKIALIPVTYSLFVWFLNLLLGISNNLTGKFNIYYKMISFLFSVFLSLTWVVWVVCLVWFMFNWIRDLHWSKQIKKFGRVLR